MKIAVIGGNFLGCATILDLALVQEQDDRTYGPSEDRFEVTLFERTTRLGGHGFRSVAVDEALNVEVGLHRTLAIPPGTYLADLLAAANDERGTTSLFGYHFVIPGAVAVRRGARGAAKFLKTWQTGSYGRIVRSFAAWDWRDDAYHLIHSGWSCLDLLYRLLDNAIWRSVALAAVLWSIRLLQRTEGFGARGLALAQCIAFFAVFLFSPKRVVAMWQKQCSFWGSTLPLLFAHGITPAIARGSSIGFVRHLVEMNTKNVATCAVSVGVLVKRAGLEPYLRGSGDDYTRKFKYNREYVDRYMAPAVAWQYAGARLSQVSSLVSHFAMLDADFANADVTRYFGTVAPENAQLCTALLASARATVPVDVRLQSSVKEIAYDEDSQMYTVSCLDGQSDRFDGILLCASPLDDEMVIQTPIHSSLSEMLGYTGEATIAKGHESQEAELQSHQEESSRETGTPIAASACSHVAVVVGVANPTFFRMTTEKSIPDFVQLTHAPGVSRFERIREVGADLPGVYTVLCGHDFQSSGLLLEMFDEGASLIFFDKLPQSRHAHHPLPAELLVDDYMPYFVLGNRFIYAAAMDRLAKHPEVDAISAVNAASLFAKAVQWAEEDDDRAAEKRGNSLDEIGTPRRESPLLDT